MSDDDALHVALATVLGLTESTVSHHLAQLRRAVLDPNCCA